MGCDIHLYVERKVPAIGWVSLGEPEALGGRNYNVFSVLANVRNGYGFAGVPTGSGYKPISEPRGLPDDVTEEVKAASDRWDCDGHSHSWLTLREILEYDYSQETTHQGVIPFEVFKDFDERRTRWGGDRADYMEPPSWSGSVFGGGTFTIPDTEARRLIASGSVATDTSRIHVRTTWKRKYLDDMQRFLVNLLAYIKYGLDDVRLVFWFDN